IDQHQFRPLGGEAFRRRKANTSQRAGDDDVLIEETLTHHSRRLPSGPRQMGLRQRCASFAASRTRASSIDTPRPGAVGPATLPPTISKTPPPPTSAQKPPPP